MVEGKGQLKAWNPFSISSSTIFSLYMCFTDWLEDAIRRINSSRIVDQEQSGSPYKLIGNVAVLLAVSAFQDRIIGQ